ncbi:hypothetical protein [Helicobacter sp. 12S02634-8]|uniref:hypothetical protein n=1 Tax=Helicobacter sp. 12S02634-8 TaxID=1476199 RepID=UPI0015561198|nr:hypothetical protein [Helicobacter sp. 12S02634-8]
MKKSSCTNVYNALENTQSTATAAKNTPRATTKNTIQNDISLDSSLTMAPPLIANL